MDTSVRIATAVHMLEAARTLVTGITGSIRDIPYCSDREVASLATTLDTGIAIEMLDSALDEMAEAIDILQAHAPHPCDEHYAIRNTAAEIDHEPHGSRDTFVPHPNPECPACGNSLPLDAECRCSGCGNG